MKIKNLARAALAVVLLTCSTSFANSLKNPIQNPTVSVSNPFPSTDPFGLSPYWDWKTLESPNFRVTFPAELRTTAARVADLLEEAHSVLSPVFQWEPSNKTQVLVIDNLDSANGAAAAVARLGILLWVTPPESWDSIGYYDDWLRLLTFHEYTHMLNMDTRGGLWKAVKYIFGDTGMPNSTWPLWMLEGLAVYIETRMTEAGRGRGPYYEMLLRAAVDEKVLNDPAFITLDKVNGTNPYFPGGDTRYQFGYQLMNQVAHEGGEKRLGELSRQSAGGVPYFINTQLSNLSGKDWYQYWKEWVATTHSRMSTDLAKIRSAPVTDFTRLTEKNHSLSNQALGARVSPDGQWLAYSLSFTGRRPGLYLRNLQTGKTRWLEDKLRGVGLGFTPDSQAILFSALQQKDQFYQFSDLMIYDLEKDRSQWLTRGARLRDPDLSPDGKWVVATLAEASTVGLALLPFSKTEGKYGVGAVQKIFMPSLYDRVSTPKFSNDGRSVYFTLHRNGQSQEDLYKIDLATLKTSPVLVDGFYNRYPALSPDGTLYFVSNATGVDNIYRLHSNGRTSMVTNMVTGVSFPTFGPTTLYASVFSSSGWDIAEIKPLLQQIEPKTVTVAPPPAPPGTKGGNTPHTDYPEKNYSPFRSLLPRLWTPTLGLTNSGAALGAQVVGFDAIDVHRYALGGVYSTPLSNLDGWAVYSDRTLGPAIGFGGEVALLRQNLDGQRIFSRELSFSSTISYPVLWTYTSLTPTLGVNFQRFFNYGTTENSVGADPRSVSNNVVSMEASLAFQNLETSGLAVGNERGGSAVVGSRVYLLQNQTSAKLYFKKEHFIPLLSHTILKPSFTALWSSTQTRDFLGANANLQGRNSFQILNPFSADGFSSLTIRGYPGVSFATRATAVSALDLRMPLARIFRGIGTTPAFLDNLFGIAFLEGGYVDQGSDQILTSAGVGLRLSSEIFYVPVVFSAEYHQGFQRNSGGLSDLFFQVLFSGFSF